MNILFLNTRDLKHPKYGGAEIHAHCLAREMVRRGHDVSFLCGGHATLPAKETVDGVHIVRHGTGLSIYFLAPFTYFRHFRGKTDLVVDVTHGLPFMSPLFSGTSVCCVVHHIHKKLFQRELPIPFSWLATAVERLSLTLLYRKRPILAISRTCEQTLKSWGCRDVLVIQPGVDEEYEKIQPEKTSAVTVLSLGRLKKYKRVDLLMTIFARVAASAPGARLVIAGTGSEEEALRAQIETLGMQNRIILKGFVSEEAKKQLLAEADIFAIASEMEGWGMVITEAAAAGVPAVGFRVPGVDESIVDGQSGILVDTPEEYEEALKTLLTNAELRNRLATGARERAHALSWPEGARQFEEWITTRLQKR